MTDLLIAVSDQAKEPVVVTLLAVHQCPLCSSPEYAVREKGKKSTCAWVKIARR